MLKVNEFENGIELSDNSMLFPFSVESNIHYRVNSLDDLKGNNYETLTQMIRHFITNQVPRLEVLDGYSKGRNAGIFSGDRRLDKNKADHRIAHNFGKLIAQFVAGYTTSVPLSYSLPDDNELNDKLLEFNKANDIATLDNELMYDVAKFGRAYDIQYKNDDGNKIKQANVFETFVIYDTTIERRPVAAV
ncbi:phage portal protein, partial [uncultured Ligilactobacillus sp.]